MFENIEPKFFFKSCHCLLQKAFQEKKKIINGNRMRLGANDFQNVRIQEKIPAFCVRSSMFEQKPYRNTIKSCHQLPVKKVEEKMSKKSECAMCY
jgi:alpha-acetolactate decarboxylase